MAADLQCPKCHKPLRREKTADGEMLACEHCGKSFARRAVAADTLTGTEACGPTSGATPADAPNRLGRFEVQGVLGRGAFGVVYRAYDQMLAREVALKVPAARSFESPQARARALREPKAAAQLRHPNIVPVFDAGFEA